MRLKIFSFNKKRRNKKQNKLRNLTLFIVGAGFVIVMFIAVFFQNYNNYRKIHSGYSYDDLKEKYMLISDEEAYGFLNLGFSDSSKVEVDSLEFIKLNCFTLKHSSKLKSFILSANDSLLSTSDKKIMLEQFTDDIYLWDNTKTTDIWFLTPKDYSKLNLSDTTDYWESFRAVFGNYGHHYYSKPLFNKTKTICVVEHNGQGGWLFGSGEILVYKKVNGKWFFWHETKLWIS